MKDVEKLRCEIRDSGYLSALQVILRLSKLSPGISRKNVELILKSLECKDIHKIEYTNSFVSSYRLKDLYYYNPTPKKKPAKRKRKTVKKV